MITIPAGLATHLAQQTSTMAVCLKIMKSITDTTVIGAFTSHDSDVVVSGVTYKSTVSFDGSAVALSNAEVANGEVFGFFHTDGFTEAAILAGVFDRATFELFGVNYEDPSLGTIPYLDGIIGEIRIEGRKYLCELKSWDDLLTQNIGRSLSPDCPYVLGDSKCTKDISAPPFTVTGTVTTATSRRVFADSTRTEAAQYFTYGPVTFTSGLNAGLSMEVKDFTSTTFTLRLPMPYNIVVGDTYTAVVGDDKKHATCRDKFNNVINFGGDPFAPGPGKLLQTKRAQ